MRTAVLALLAGLAAGGAPPGRTPARIAVAIEQMRFAPADAAAKTGDRIVWTNKDVVAHTVTSTTGAFDSKLIPPGGTWTYVVKGKGAFGYKCSYHPTMAAAFTVR